MRAFFLLGVILLTSSSLRAAPLQNLSEKLSSAGGDQTKEKIPDEETHIIEPKSVNNSEDEANVEDLENLKSSSDVDSLRKLHDSNSHHKHTEEKPVKPFRGAARLAFGQNAEEATEAPTTVRQKEIYENLPLPDAIEMTSTTTATRNGHRRSLKSEMSPNAATMLRHLNGKFSAYDMAQYIFWTGDEQGVAKAVEELIDEGLMSRENAIEFLNDIRLGIDYLENTYNAKHSETKNTMPFARATTTSSTTEQSFDELPFSYNYNYQKFHSLFKPSHKTKVHVEEDETPTLSPVAFKALENLTIPSLLRLTEMQTLGDKLDTTATYDDEGGRTRLADFLYGEYSLEEVIYQLAKTMFTQSLTHGSEESQAALQKLTQFLESEGKHGRISPALQKKVLDVLLAALSDTLNENPDVLAKARHALTEKK